MNIGNVNRKLVEILRLLPKNNNLVFMGEDEVKLKISNGKTLLEIKPSDLIVSEFSAADKLFRSPSPLADVFVSTSQIKDLFAYLFRLNLFNNLNHLGVCYRVDSIVKEKEKLINNVKKSGLHLYEEYSQDGSSWLYVGDTANWQDPLVEVVLIEKTNDRWENYWLPHIQIDIDTYLNGDEIERLILDIFKGKVKPFRLIEENNFIIVVRARLGSVSGININLDLGFEGRMTRYHRYKLLKQLV